MRNGDAISGEILTIKILENLNQHDVIYSVATDIDGKIYFAPSSEFYPGSSARIYCYDPESDNMREVVDVEKVTGEKLGEYQPSHSKIHLSMVIGKDGAVYAATHFTAPPKNEKFAGIYETYGDPKRGYPGSVVIAYCPETDRAECLGRVVPFEGTREMTIDKERNILYMVTMPRSHLIAFDIKERTSRDLGRISMENPLGIECDSRGFVYTTDDEGYIVRYNPEEDILERLSVRIPDAPWRNGRANYVRRTTLGPDGNTIWGFGTKSVRLFEYNTTAGSEGKMYDHGTFCGKDQYGRWPHLLACKAMTFGKDSKLYISFSEDEGVVRSINCRICSFDPKTGEKRDFGIIQGENTPPVIAAMDASGGHDGRIYFGTRESQPPPQLAVFIPPDDSVLDEVSTILRPDTSSKSCRDIVNWQASSASEEMERSVMYKLKKTSPFVQEGTLTLRELGWPKLGLVIPDGESQITSLVRTNDGKIYGATSGNRSHLFLYNPFEMAYLKEHPGSYPMEVRLIEDEPAVCRGLVVARDGKIYGGTIIGDEDAPKGGALFMYDPSHERLIWEEHGLPRRPFFGCKNLNISKLCGIAEGEGIFTITIDEERDIIYGLTCPNGYFFIFDVIKRKIIGKKKIGMSKLCRTLICDSLGNVYGSCQEGLLFRYNREKGCVEDLNVRIPTQKGRDYLNAVNSFTMGKNGLIYGGTVEGYLFAYDTIKNKLFVIGRPTMLPGIPALTTGNDGRIYGISGGENDMAHLFSYNPVENELKDLGILQVNGVPKFWVGHRFASMVTGLNGEIFIGESDRISHLFIYYPPVIFNN